MGFLERLASSDVEYDGVLSEYRVCISFFSPVLIHLRALYATKMFLGQKEIKIRYKRMLQDRRNQNVLPSYH